MENTTTTLAGTCGTGFRSRVGLQLGSDLEGLLGPVRRKLRERTETLGGDMAAAAMQLLSESQFAGAGVFAHELILAAFEELRGPAH